MDRLQRLAHLHSLVQQLISLERAVMVVTRAAAEGVRTQAQTYNLRLLNLDVSNQEMRVDSAIDALRMHGFGRHGANLHAGNTPSLIAYSTSATEASAATAAPSTGAATAADGAQRTDRSSSESRAAHLTAAHRLSASASAMSGDAVPTPRSSCATSSSRGDDGNAGTHAASAGAKGSGSGSSSRGRCVPGPSPAAESSSNVGFATRASANGHARHRHVHASRTGARQDTNVNFLLPVQDSAAAPAQVSSQDDSMYLDLERFVRQLRLADADAGKEASHVALEARVRLPERESTFHKAFQTAYVQYPHVRQKYLLLKKMCLLLGLSDASSCNREDVMGAMLLKRSLLTF